MKLLIQGEIQEFVAKSKSSQKSVIKVKNLWVETYKAAQTLIPFETINLPKTDFNYFSDPKNILHFYLYDKIYFMDLEWTASSIVSEVGYVQVTKEKGWDHPKFRYFTDQMNCLLSKL